MRKGANKILYYKLNQRWTWEQIAEGTGYSTSHIQKISKGNVNPSTEAMERVAKFFGKTVAEVFYPEDIKNIRRQ